MGGAAVLAKYGFRNTTTDIDAIICASSAMDEAIRKVRDKFHLPHDWINADFIHTNSYTPKLVQYSEYYRTYSNVLSIRIVTAEYLIAMKLRSGRKYKSDMSDIVGILNEHQKQNCPIVMEEIDKAVVDLYGGWDDISEESKQFLEATLKSGNYEELYNAITQEELDNKSDLIEFEVHTPGVLNTSNVNSILQYLKEQRTDNAKVDK